MPRNTVPDDLEVAAPIGSASEKAEGGIQSLNRAFSILEAVAAAPAGVTLKALSQSVGLHNSTAFHLLKTMVALGYVEQDGESKRYRVGRAVLKLVGRADNIVDLLNVTEPFVEELSDRTGENAHYATRLGGDVQVVVRTDGQGAFRLTDRLGPVRPAHATAIGKVLLAFQPPQRLDRHLATIELKRYTDVTITDKRALREELERVRSEQVAFDDREFHPELRCVAVPIHDYRGNVTGALGISAPSWRVGLPALRKQVGTVKEVADRVSAAFGYRRLRAS